MNDQSNHPPSSIVLIAAHGGHYARAVWASPDGNEWKTWCKEPVLLVRGEAYEVWEDWVALDVAFLLIANDGVEGFLSAWLERIPSLAVVNALRAFVTADLAATVPSCPL